MRAHRMPRIKCRVRAIANSAAMKTSRTARCAHSLSRFVVMPASSPSACGAATKAAERIFYKSENGFFKGEKRG